MTPDRRVVRAAAALALTLLAVSGAAAGIEAVPVGVVPFAIRAADLDGDGRSEILVGGLDRDAIVAVAADGRRLWEAETAGMPAALRAGDLTGDGATEIVALIGTSASKIVVLDADGKLLREIQPEVIVYFLELADIDGDDRDEIVVAGFMGRVLAYELSGAKILNETVVPNDFLRRMAGLATGDVDGDGRADIAHQGSLQALGVIDGDGNGIPRSVPLDLEGAGLVTSADLDGDGTFELVLASIGRVRVETLTDKVWSVDLSQSAAELGAEADGTSKLRYEYGGTRSLAVGDFTAGAGSEIATFASDGKFELLSAAGEILLRTKSVHPFLAIASGDLDGDGRDEALLSRIHEKSVLVVRFSSDLEDTGAEIQDAMSTDAVTDAVDGILTRLDAVEARGVRAGSHDEKLHLLWGMDASTAPALLAATIRVIDEKMREQRSANVEVAFMFTLKERGVCQFKRDGICAVSDLALTGEAILDLCRGWEEMGARFYAVVSHMGVPTVMPETARRIMEVAPNACQGYITWETMTNYPGEIWYDFLGRTAELAEICRERGKKILLAEEAPFWLALVSDPRSRAILLKPEYRQILVPVLKTLNPFCVETDVSAYLGSMLAGEIETWGITSEEDFWPIHTGFYRGCPDDIVMRQELMAVALGARYLMIESGHFYYEPLDAFGNPNWIFATSCRISREARREHLVVELFEKGIVGPVRGEDLLGIAPLGLRFSPSPRMTEAPYQWRSHGMRRFDGAGLVNYDISNVQFDSGPHSLSRNLYGSRKLMESLFPVNEGGILPIFGPDVSVAGIHQVDSAWETDGEFVTTPRGRQAAQDAMPEIVAAYRAGRADLPFRAEGAFLSARRDGEGRYQVFVMDPEMFAPAERTVTVTTSIPWLTCADELTDEPIPVSAGEVSVAVPAGGFRLLRFEESVPSGAIVDACLVPEKCKLRTNAKKPRKSTFVVAGRFDTGRSEVDLAGAATVTIGDLTLAIPGLVRRSSGKLRHDGDGLRLKLDPSKRGSSRGSFELKVTGSEVAAIEPDAEIDLSFRNVAVEMAARVRLEKGAFERRGRGALVVPDLHLEKAKATLDGAGRDRLRLVFGLVTDGIPPPTATSLTVSLGDFRETIPAASFTRTGDAYRYEGGKGALTSAVLDYRKGRLTLKGKGLSLGPFPEGAQPVLIALTLGTDERAVAVRLIRRGTSLRY